uniref:Malic enzyme NAD-binding domain-containing protein n=1 Tax=Timema poppense TaxID=170557 RepID=A0A7R9CJF3_TIMPO|nr:unnamed protein product [Timema poppensis]
MIRKDMCLAAVTSDSQHLGIYLNIDCQKSNGCCLFGSGAPDVTKNFDEGSDVQGSTGSTLMSHAYVSPGVTLGVLCTRMHHVADDIFIIAAQK